MATKQKGMVETPFVDYQVPDPASSETSNISLQGGDPGYKKQTPSPNIPATVSRHRNQDGGATINEAHRPDALKKRVG